MPVALEMKEQGDIIPWVALDSHAESYYKTRKITSMRKQDFEIGGHSTLEKFSEDMTAFWKNNGDSKLCELVPSLVELANEFYAVENKNEEISPYIYVMF